MAKRKAEQRTAATPDRVESGRSIGADMARRLNERLWAEARWRRQQRFLLEEQARIARRYASPAPASAPASPPAPATPPDAELVKQAARLELLAKSLPAIPRRVLGVLLAGGHFSAAKPLSWTRLKSRAEFADRESVNKQLCRRVRLIATCNRGVYLTADGQVAAKSLSAE